MYQKMLVPLDGSKESENVLHSVQGLLDPESEVILLKVIPPMTGQTIGQMVLTGGQREEVEEAKVMDYLRGLVRHLGAEPTRWHCRVVMSKSVAGGITNFAIREGVDLIAMYTHDRKGLARLVRDNIAEEIRHRAPIEVKVFRARELATTGS